MAKHLKKKQARLDARRKHWDLYKTGPSTKHIHRRPGSMKK